MSKKWKRVDRNIYKKGNSDNYWIRICHKGVAIEKPVGPRLKEARQELVEIKSQINKGTISKIPYITFEEMSERFLEHCEAELRDPSRPAITIKHAMGLLGDKLLRDITALDIEKYKRMRRNTIQKNGKPISDTTVRKELLHLNRLFVLAERWDLVPPGYNPVRKVDKPKEAEGRLPELSLEEEKKLLLACPPGLKPIVKFAIYSGLRQGEIVGLTWDRVNMERCQVYLEKTKNSRARHVGLCKPAMDVLKSLYNCQTEGHVFLSQRHGKPYTCIKAIYARARKRAGLDELRFHDLRHVFASRLREAGASLGDIVEALGQRDVKMALRYAHLSPDYMGGVVGRLDEPDGRAQENSFGRFLDDSS